MTRTWLPANTPDRCILLVLAATACGSAPTSIPDAGSTVDAAVARDADRDSRTPAPLLPVLPELTAACAILTPSPTEALVGVFYTSECNCSASPGTCEVVDSGDFISLMVGDREPQLNCRRCEQTNVCRVPRELAAGRAIVAQYDSFGATGGDGISAPRLVVYGASRCDLECQEIQRQFFEPECSDPAPPVAPPTWTCPNSDYGTGNGCHCDCGARDLDCHLLGEDAQLFGCETLQTQLTDRATAWCPLGQCSDRCNGATAQYQCDAARAALHHCPSSGGRVDETCAQNYGCRDGERARCAYEGHCYEGESYCDGQTRRSCVDGQWIDETCSAGCFEHPLAPAGCASLPPASIRATVTYRTRDGTELPGDGFFVQALREGDVVGSAVVSNTGELELGLSHLPPQRLTIRVWALWTHRGLPRLAVLDSSDTEAVRSWEFSFEPATADARFVIDPSDEVELFVRARDHLRWFDALLAPAHPNPLQLAVRIDVDLDCDLAAGCFANHAVAITEPTAVDFGHSVILVTEDRPFLAAHEFGHAIDTHLAPHPDGVSLAPPGTHIFSEAYSNLVGLAHTLPFDGSVTALGEVDYERPDPAMEDPAGFIDRPLLRRVSAAFWDLVDDTPVEDPVHLPIEDVIGQLISPHNASGDYGRAPYVDFLGSFVCSGAASADDIRAIAELNEIEDYEDPNCQ